MNFNGRNFRSLIRAQIAGLGVKQFSVAEAIGLSPSLLSHKLWGRRGFKKHEALRLVRLLDELENDAG